MVMTQLQSIVVAIYETHVGHFAWAYNFGGLLPLVKAKGDPLIKNIDIVKFEMGPTFPIWPGLIPSFAWASVHHCI